MRNTDSKPIWTDDEIAELRAIIAERRDAREKARPTPELLGRAGVLIGTLVHMLPEYKAGCDTVLGHNWIEMCDQLRDGAAYLSNNNV